MQDEPSYKNISEIDSPHARILASSLKDIPPLPQLAAKALDLISHEDIDLSELSDLILKDPTLTAKILSYVNSAHYALPKPITDIKKAVLVLGVTEVKSILLRVLTTELILKSLSKSLLKAHRHVVLHSYLTAIISELIMEKVNTLAKSEAFVCGLLHDIGKILLMITFPDEYISITLNYTQMTSLQFEHQAFGIDHCISGKWLAEKWKLPQSIIQSIWLHHQNSSIIADLAFIEKKQILLCTTLSNYLAHVSSVDSLSAYTVKEEIDHLCNYFNIEYSDIQNIFLKAGQALEKSAEFIELSEDLSNFYFNSLQRAINHLYELSKSKFLLQKQEKHTNKLKALIKYTIAAYAYKSLDSLMAITADFLRKIYQINDGLVLLFDLSQKKVNLVKLGSHSNLLEYPFDKFFEKETAIDLEDKHIEVIKKRLLHQLSKNEATEQFIYESQKDLFCAYQQVINGIRGEVGLILKGFSPSTSEDYELLSQFIAIFKNAVISTYYLIETRKISESLAVTLSKNSEMLNILSKSKAEFENLFKHSNDPIVIHSANGYIKRINSRFKDLFGYEEDEVVNSSLFNLFPNLNTEDKNQAITAWMSEKGCLRELNLLRKDGEIVPVQISSRIVSKEDGIIQSIIRDLSEEKARTKELNLEKERLLVTLRSIGEGVITTDKNGTITLMNKVAEVLTGYTQEEASGKPLSSIFRTLSEQGSPDFLDIFSESMDPKKPSRHTQVAKLIDKSGSYHPIAYTISPIVGDEGELIGMVIVLSDLREKMMIQEQFFKAQKYESLALLSGGVAHDFNNILTAVSGNISIARMNLNNPEKAKEKLLLAEKAIERAKELTNQLFTFAKPKSITTKGPIKTKELLLEAVNLAISGSQVLCNFKIPEDIWPLNCNASQINQVINNLVVNAKEAMPQGGKLTVSASNVVVSQENPLANLAFGKYVKIDIIDEGMGIPQEVIYKIFDPYFSTKERGTGLGLAIAYSIVKKHGGTIEVASEVKKGSTFSLYLPAASSRKGLDKTEGQRELVKGQGKVLLMEDQEEVSLVAKEILESLGYEVVLAFNGEEALKALETDTFRIAILDLTIRGGMGALQILPEVRKSKKVDKILVSSGYAQSEILKNYKTYGFDGAIEKPYNIDKVNQALKDLNSN